MPFSPQSWQHLIVAVQILHGICYAFFFATVYIFRSMHVFSQGCPGERPGRCSIVMVLGIGVLAANSICPHLIQETYNQNGITDFKHLFLLPCYAGLFAMLLLIFAFHPPKDTTATAGPGSAPH